jgi:hypothetical protein
MATSAFFATVLPYDDGEKAGVAIIALAGLVSLTAVMYLFMFNRPKRTTFKDIHMFGYFMSLLFANILQSTGTVMNFAWVGESGVKAGALCSAQGGIKHIGNVGASIWSLIIALHLFNILFLRIRATRTVFIGTLISAWSFILFVLLVGRFAIQKPEKGPYFGISGSWCWITPNYGVERVVMEYLFSFISIGFSFILYILVLLRVRGNLVRDRNHIWRLRFVGVGNEWKLSITRDAIDNSMNKVAHKLVWYPISYAIIVVPISITRIADFNGANIPFWATALTDVLFNLMGLVNVILVIYIEGYFPEATILPNFSTKRQAFRDSLARSGGIVPFTLQRSGSEEKYVPEDSQRFVVSLPTKPQNMFVAPDSWKTTAPKGSLF